MSEWLCDPFWVFVGVRVLWEREKGKGQGYFGNLKNSRWGPTSHVEDALIKPVVVLKKKTTKILQICRFHCWNAFRFRRFVVLLLPGSGMWREFYAECLLTNFVEFLQDFKLLLVKKSQVYVNNHFFSFSFFFFGINLLKFL